jgi:hypothetical protein
MRAILLVAVLICQPGWSQTRDQPAPRASDGDTYKPPTSIKQTPKNHPRETDPGRRPPIIRGGNPPWVIGALGGVGIALPGIQPEKKLSRDGPAMPNQFSMSGFSIGAFCQAQWPVVVDYFLEAGANVVVTVQSAGFPTATYLVEGTGARRQFIFLLPANFPAKPTAGMYTIRAVSKQPGGAPVFARLFGVGGGVRAVGSVAIDQVQFGPGTIHTKQKENASYAFHAHTDFDKVRAEFMKAVLAQGQIVSVLEDHDDVNGVQRETTPTREWNGRKATAGEHLLQVRAWESTLNKSNWVIAWSTSQVLVEE